MKEDYLEHAMLAGWKPFTPKYYKKVGTPPFVRYFYSRQEYARWVNGQRKQTGMDEEIAQEEERTAAQAKDFKARTAVPSRVSVGEYVFGGQYGKDLRSSKTKLKQAKKQLRRDEKEAAKLLKRIRKLESKRPSERNRIRIASLKKEREEVMKRVVSGMSDVNSQSREVTIALCRYESTTLVGHIRKKLRNASDKAQKIIEKYSNMAVSKINAPVINTGEKPKAEKPAKKPVKRG